MSLADLVQIFQVMEASRLSELLLENAYSQLNDKSEEPMDDGLFSRFLSVINELEQPMDDGLFSGADG